MESFIRSEAIQALLHHADEITPEELDRTIKLGLKDEDLQINEDTLNFLLKSRKILDYQTEVEILAKKFLNSSETYYVRLGQKVFSLVQGSNLH